MLAGAGDEGSTEPVNVAGTLLSTTRAIGWPASDPLVTAVGGTQLHLNLAGKRLLPDNVWNDTNLLGGPAAGGGGLSAIFSRPSYEDSVSAVAGAWRNIRPIWHGYFARRARVRCAVRCVTVPVLHLLMFRI